MIDKELIKKYNVAGPRYTSYPPANHFSETFNSEQYVEMLKFSNEQTPSGISLYVHIPFCPQICNFCGCNTTLYKDDETVKGYFNALAKEIKMIAQYLDRSRKVIQIHWGGGTPNSVSFDLIEGIMELFQDEFTISPYAEIAMECNPAYLDLSDLIRLQKMGFNRISLGIQDFNPDVLKTINRIPSKYPAEDLFRTARKVGFKGVNLDLVYGLPGQTKQDFLASLERAIQLEPDRLVTFSYAHVPWFKEHQKKLEKYTIPGPDEKLDMLKESFNILNSAGYKAIGMDHYAKPNDELYIALQNKELHRNFQGYCTRETTGQVYAFGATAISQLDNAYAQNIRSIKKYMEILEQGQLPVMRGYQLNKNEKIIRKAINEVMCNHYLDLHELAEKYHVSVEELKQVLKFDISKFHSFIADDLVEIKGDVIRVKPQGFFLIRNIAMAFDPMLEEKENQYSKTI